MAIGRLAAVAFIGNTEVVQRDLPTFLSVEDDDGLRLSLQRLLDSSRFELDAAGSAEETLELVPKLGGLDLLITDIVIPGESGFQLAERLESDHPGIEVILVSGYSYDAAAKYRPREDEEDRWQFIQKPFYPDAFVGLVERLVSQGEDEDGDKPS